MAASYHTRAARVLRLYCPVAPATLAALTAGDPAAIEHDPTLARMLAILRSPNPLGDFGLYTSVVEAAPGWELFTPGAAAQPTLGTPGAHQASPTVVLTVHIAADAPAAAVDAALAALLDAHPWEVPVIELAEVQLLLRR